MTVPESEYLQTWFPRCISATDDQREDGSGGSHHVGGAAWSVFMDFTLGAFPRNLWSRYCTHDFQLTAGGSRLLRSLLIANWACECSYPAPKGQLFLMSKEPS